jgi:thiol-disulfide isomerase/thioredoxin
MVEIENITQLKEAIARNQALMIYFYNDTCAPCVALRPKVSEMAESEFPLIKLYFCNALTHPEIASEYGIYASPTLLIFFEGKEYIRESKYISIQALKESISRYYDLVFNN